MNVTDAGLRPVPVAVSVFAPAFVPSVQLPTVATPDALVVALAPVIVPPPLATAKVIANPGTPFPNASDTLTAGRTGTGLPANPNCASPAAIARVVGAPGTTVTFDVALFPSDVAVIVACPGRSAVSNPFASMVAIDVAELVHVTGRVSGCCSLSLSVAAN